MEGGYTGFNSLESVVLNSGLETIGDYVFENCFNLTEISIPDTVTSIGAYAFSNCNALTDIIVWKNVDKVGNRAFNAWSEYRTIYIEAETIPSTWDIEWNADCNANIVYGYTGQ